MLNFARNKTISGMIQSGMPNMATTLNGWEVPITLEKITQSVIEGDLVTSKTQITFQGVWQPLRGEELQLKPEGQRSWSWYWIHAKSGTLDLQTADKVIFQGKRYKVMDRKDYNLNGYIEYHVILDYQDGDNND